MELYSIKSVVEIEKVNLSIRFPGQLSFQFKNNHLYEDIPKMYQLNNGQCTVEQSVALEVEAIFNPNDQTYNEVLVDLIISINTSSGKIAAGVVTFNAIQNTTATFPLKRCSDKTAEVTMNIGFARIKKIKDIQQQVVVSKQKSDSRLLLNIKSREMRSIDEMRPSFLISERKKDIDRNDSKEQRILMASKVLKTIGMDSRYKDLEESYDKKIKLLNREKQQLQNQLQSTRQKWKLSERRQKELQTSTKDLRDLAEKRKVKIADLQNKLSDYEKIIQDYERKIKMTFQESKLSTDKIEDLSSKYLMLEKKIESKEQTMSERERRLSEKLQQLESEHNKTVHQYNLLLEKMELQEKANQTIFKNKQKGHLEEKARLKQQFQKSDRSHQKLKEQYDQLMLRYQNIASNERALTLKHTQLESEHEILKNEDQNRKATLERLFLIKKELERELEQLRGIEVDKNSLKKKINENSQEYLKLKEKLDKFTFQNEEIRENLKISEKIIDELKKQKRTLTNRCGDLEKSLSQQQKEYTKLSLQNNTLSSKNTFLNQRLNDLKTKSQQQNNAYKENENQLQSKISSLIQSKQYLEADIEDLKWNIQKIEDNVYDCERKLKEKNDEILKYQEENLKLEKESQNISMRLDEAKNDITSLKNEVSQCKRRQQELVETLKEKQRKIYEQLKRISELEQENFISASKFNNNIENYKDNLVVRQSTIEQLRSQITEKKIKLSALQNSLQKLEEDHQQQDREIKFLVISLEESDRNLKLEREGKEELKKLDDSLKKQLQESQSKFSEQEKNLNEVIVDLKAKHEFSEKQLRICQGNIETYQRSTQQLLIIISNDDEVTKCQDVIAYPDQNLAKNQLEALLSRNKYLSNFKSSINELQVQINYLQKQNENKTNALHSKNEELQRVIKQNSQKVIQLQANWHNEVLSHNQQISEIQSQLQSLRNEKQKLECKYKTLQQSYDEEKSMKQQLESHLNLSKDQIKKLQESHLELRSRQISKKGEDESVIHSLKLELQSEMDKYKQKISDINRQIVNSQKTIGQKDKQISSMKNNMSSLQQEKNKVESSLQSLHDKYNKLSQVKVQGDQKLSEAQKVISTLSENLQKANIEITSERQLKNILETKLKDSHEHAQELLVNKENLENKLNNILKSSTLSQEEQRAKITQLQDNLNNQLKKSNRLFKQLTQKSGELQLKQFLIKQLQQRLAENEASSNELKKDIEDKRNTINRLNLNIQEQSRKIMGVQKEKNDYSQEKNAVQDELTIKKVKIEELEDEIKALNSKLQKVNHQLQDSSIREKELKDNKENLQKNLNELRENLSEAKKDVQRSNAKENQSRSKLNLVQDQLKQKEEFYQNFKSKNWEQNQRESSSLRQKVKQLEAKIDLLETQRQNERQELKTELQYVSQCYHDLEELLEEKEQVIEKQELQIFQSQSRITSLNGELRSCLEAWEKEKTASIPSRKQTIKIEEDMNKFQSYAVELDRKTKEIVNISTFKIKDEIMAKTAQSLVELLELLHRSKSRALNKANDTEKSEIVKEYDRMRENIEEILKNQKISAAKE